MAHQYSAAPPYGAQYPTNPYYSPFSPSVVQQMSNGIPGLQQSNTQSSNLQTAANSTNSLRYDANAQIHPQLAPLPFAPPHFDPELLKHFPPPPLLPPPGSHFGAASNSISGFPPFPPVANLSPHPTAPHNFLHLAQQSTSSNAVSIPNQPATPTNDPRISKPSVTIHRTGATTDPLRSQQSPGRGTLHDYTTTSSSGRLFDGTEDGQNALRKQSDATMDDNEVRRNSGRATDSNSQHYNPLSSVVAQTARPSRHGSNNGVHAQTASQPDLKERAKAALLSLIPHNIQYDDIRSEGIDAQVLQRLYEEIGLGWQTSIELNRPNSNVTRTPIQKDSNITEQRKSTSIEPPSVSTAAGIPSAKISSAMAASTTVPPASNQNMARKDRIAQLLAAKAAKVAGPDSTSKSHSPASAAEPTQNQTSDPEVIVSAETALPTKRSRTTAQADMMKQETEPLQKENAIMNNAEQIQPTLDTQTFSNQTGITEMLDLQHRQATTLSTPVREHLVKNGLSSLIPGLFLTSAELEEEAAPAPLHPNQTASDEQSFVATAIPQTEQLLVDTNTSTILPVPNFRKRSVDEIMGDVKENHQSSKRQALQADQPLNVSSKTVKGAEEDDASEGEIVEEEEPVARNAQVPSTDSAVGILQVEDGQHNHVHKQSDIETMRRRIAEMEQRHGLKREQRPVLSPTGSSISIPTLPSVPVNVTSSPLSKAPEQAFPSTKIDDRPAQSPRSLVKATPEQIAERAAQLKADFLRSRALRQKQLQEGIPALDNEVAKTRHKLKIAKDKLSEIVADILQQYLTIDRTRAKEKEVEEEIAGLEKQLSDGVSGQKQFSKELNHLKHDGNKSTAVQPPSSLSPLVSQSQHQISQDQASQSRPAHILEIEAVHEDSGPNRGQSKPDVPFMSQQNMEVSHVAEQQSSSRPVVGTEERERFENKNEADAKASWIANSEYQSPVSTAPALSQSELRGEDIDHVEDSDEPMEESDEDSEDSHMSIDEDTNDSASMSDSGSDDYEPAEPEDSPQSDEKMESDEYEPNIENSEQLEVATEEEGGAEGDDYEPAESLSPVNTTGHSSSPRSAQTAFSPTDAYNELSDTNSFHQEKPLAVSEALTTTGKSNVDDQEKGLQLSEADTLTKPQNLSFEEKIEGSDVLGASEPTLGRYVPYQSPLTSLKSYRFHPSFKDEVKDGYRSLTYSHKIDPKSPICLTELGGDPCTDPQCQDQHFGSMALPDDKILVQMSSASNIKDKKLRDQFLVGLKQMIARLRQEGVKDFTAVADALSQYRREWRAAQAGS